MFSSSRYPERTFAIVNAAMRLAGIKDKLMPDMLAKLSRVALMALARSGTMPGTFTEVQHRLEAGEQVPKRLIDEIDGALFREARKKKLAEQHSLKLVGTMLPAAASTETKPREDITAKLERDLREVLADYFLSRLVSHEQILDTLDKITASLRAVTKLAS